MFSIRQNRSVSLTLAVREKYSKPIVNITQQKIFKTGEYLIECFILRTYMTKNCREISTLLPHLTSVEYLYEQRVKVSSRLNKYLNRIETYLILVIFVKSMKLSSIRYTGNYNYPRFFICQVFSKLLFSNSKFRFIPHAVKF